MRRSGAPHHATLWAARRPCDSASPRPGREFHTAGISARRMRSKLRIGKAAASDTAGEFCPRTLLRGSLLSQNHHIAQPVTSSEGAKYNSLGQRPGQRPRSTQTAERISPDRAQYMTNLAACSALSGLGGIAPASRAPQGAASLALGFHMAPFQGAGEFASSIASFRTPKCAPDTEPLLRRAQKSFRAS